MRARVTNLGRGARGFHTTDRGTVLLEPGAATVLSLADHPIHDAWIAAGEVAVVSEDEPDPAAARARPPVRPTTRHRDG